MGSVIKLNDTLQITREQGFPSELDYEKHKIKPFKVEDFEGKVFEFKKPDIRIYKTPPVRNFFVENKNGKWLYWGLVNILELHHDYGNNITSGKFKITYIYTPEEMKKAQELIDRRSSVDFFVEDGK